MITTSDHSRHQRESLMMLTIDILFACFGFGFLFLPPTAVSKKAEKKVCAFANSEIVQ